MYLHMMGLEPLSIIFTLFVHAIICIRSFLFPKPTPILAHEVVFHELPQETGKIV